ncbi:MAG: glutamine synthetase III [Bacteroidales bacterium]|nr:glutamine synthetase III [Bacteroidales bacterium]
MSTLRFNLVQEAFNHQVVPAQSLPKNIAALYGENVFNLDTMRRCMSRSVYKKVQEAIAAGKAIDPEIAESVALAMKKWAMKKGATHYTHWFHPLNDGTAEKHDSFIQKDGPYKVIEEFNGKLLVQQEPDASSFPNGGIRNTFEARGYSAWDPSSPAFIVDDTLCIPTIFISYTGEALDYKTPLLKSLSAVCEAAKETCGFFVNDVQRVTSNLGWEQEYFLVDEALFSARPDLMMCGRTIMGHESAKNQQLEDHYFGSIPKRVVEYMKDLELEAYKLGIPLKTRHNEVAPNQFEFAPIYEETNLAVDHNLVLMDLMRKVAPKHHFRVLLHEKPFAGINGSGKHCNWSLTTDTGINLFAPGKHPKDNLLFVTFLVNTLMAVHKHNALLKASVASAGNAYRLGAHEAPPAIISVFLGTQLTQLLADFEKEDSEDGLKMKAKSRLNLNVSVIPELMLDNTDRNRTSPFAFTGNRFEFRAAGSSANCASSMIVLNTAVAGQLMDFNAAMKERMTKGESKEQALYALLREYIKIAKPVCFEGNGYSDEWKAEASRRGLDCETSIPLQYDAYLKPQSIDLFAQTKVLNEKELAARNEVKWETYTKKIQIEARVLGDLALNHIVPVAIKYQSSLLDNLFKLKTLYKDEDYQELSVDKSEKIKKIEYYINQIQKLTDAMVEARKVANRITNEREKAIAYHDTVEPYFEKIRNLIDELELMVDNELWPLPKYRELLFIR